MPNAIEDLLSSKTVSAQALADELAWPQKQQHRRARFDGCLLLTLGEEPALAIVDSGVQALDFAYHSGYDWVLDTRQSANKYLFNTRWRSQGQVYKVDLSAFQPSEVRTSFSPDGLEQNLPATLSRRLLQFDQQVSSIETALIKKLGDLRRMAFRYSTGEPRKLDHDLHLLITQLFILRAIEDLGIARQLGLKSLKETKASNRLNGEVLADIFRTAKARVQSKLFDQSPYLELPEAALFAAIDALYEEDDVPESKRLNFGWIDPHVFGQVYERYLSTILAEAPLPTQGTLFDSPAREVEEITQRKQGGVYYTPQPLVRILVQKAIDIACPDGISAEHLPRIADFACGSGAFLAGALDKLLSLFPPPERTSIAKRIIDEKRIVGIDIDDRAVALARLNLYLRLAQENNIFPLPDLEGCVVAGDSLAKELPDSLKDLDYNAIVGNPPFLATGLIEDRAALSARFKTAIGRYDFSSLFVELAFETVGDKGAVALVVPNRLFINAAAQPIRDYVVSHSTIDTIVDFGSAPVFEGVTAYIGLLICRKELTEQPAPVRRVHIKRFPAAFPLEPVVRSIFTSEEVSQQELDAYSDSQPLPGDPWNSIPPSMRLLVTRLESSGVRIGDIAEVRQGIKTGANYVFILTLHDVDSGPIQAVVDDSGRKHFVEKALLKQAAIGSQISKFKTFRDVLPGSKVLIYPYEGGLPISEHLLAERFPFCYDYLLQNKRELQTRVSVVGSGQPWFGLVRPRDDNWLESPKILSRDLIAEPSFGIDETGGTYLVSGTALVPTDSDLIYSLLGIMNSKVFGEVLRQGAAEFKGQYVKAEPGRLLELYVPNSAINDLLIAELVQKRINAVDAEIDQIELEIEDAVKAHFAVLQ